MCHGSCVFVRSFPFKFFVVSVLGFFFSIQASALLCDDSYTHDTNLPIRSDVLILVNDNSVDSCEVGKYYAQERNIPKANIAHIAVPTTKLIDWDNFRSMMDQVIAQLLNHVEPSAPVAPVCDSNTTETTPTDGSPYYCQAVMDYIRNETTIRYIVSTQGIPAKAEMPRSVEINSSESAGVDNQMKYWLLRFFPDIDGMPGSDATRLNFVEREYAFGDGRGMREVDVNNDGEFIFGRIDGYNLEASKRLVDRAVNAEKNGIYGIHYGDRYEGSAFVNLSQRIGLQWFEFTDPDNPDSVSNVYGEPISYIGRQNELLTNRNSAYRYQLGIFGEDKANCLDPLYPNGDNLGISGFPLQAPLDCKVRFGDFYTANTSSANGVPGNGSTYYGLDALSWFGDQNTRSSGGKAGFEAIKRTIKSENCGPALCKDHADPAQCRLDSTDALKELNTECVGVADGFFGQHVRSYSMTHDWVWPTGWTSNNTDATNNFFHPRVRTNDSANTADSTSLWFFDHERVSGAKCYADPSGADTNFNIAPQRDCESSSVLNMQHSVSLPAGLVTVNTVNPQTYNASFYYKYDDALSGQSGTVSLEVVAIFYNSVTDKIELTDPITLNVNESATWSSSGVMQFQVPPTFPSTEYDTVRIRVKTTAGAAFSGELGFDDFSLKEVGTSNELLINGSFSEGYESVASGDHAAVYLSRLNGLAFWGSFTHYQANGSSFADNALETMIYFYRGLPLGDAVWWGENDNGGLFYGDPLYSPIAVRFDYLNNDYDAVLQDETVSLTGIAINGRDDSLVDTTYEIDYCVGNDFYVCNQNNWWTPTTLSGSGGPDNGSNGNFSASWDLAVAELSEGPYTLRLKVRSQNSTKGRDQSFYDYYPIHVYAPLLDDDSDGLINQDELANGTDPANSDSDGDGLSDDEEVNVYFSDPLSEDSDNDGMPDKWEVDNGLGLNDDQDALLDGDGDGLANIDEYLNNANPNNPDSDGDELGDRVEVEIHNTYPDNIDTDSDGLTDLEEVTAGANPLVKGLDTDNDGLPDDWEIVRGTNESVPDGNDDPDNDGFANALEFIRNTLPLEALSYPVVNTLYIDPVNYQVGMEDGSTDYPYETLSSALSNAQEGDTLLLSAGPHTETSNITVNKNVRITGAPNRNSHLSVTSIKFENASSSEYLLWTEFRGLKISLTSANASMRIVGELSNVTITGNEIDTNKNGFILGSSQHTVIKNNVLHNNTVGEGFGIRMGSSDGVLIQNNTIVNFEDGITLLAPGGLSSPTNFLIQNNIITNNTGEDLEGFADATGIWYNLLGDDLGFQTQGNFMDDPLFVNATNHDYHLQDWISPAIDKGHPDSRFESEPASFSHVESVNGGRINVGAYGNTSEAAASRDFDLDGISDAEELDRGLTSTGLPPATDADGDGIPDDWEVVRNTNPSMADGNDDLDGDGFSNVLEFILGTLPDNEFSYPTVNTIHVNPLNQTGFENGSATDPYEKLSTALLNANDGDTLILSAGPHDETSVVKVEKSVRIMGAPNRGSHLTVPNISFGNNLSGGGHPSWGELLGLKVSGKLSMTGMTKNVTVVGNDISTTANGIALSGSYNTVIKNNVLRGPGTTHFGIRLAGSTGATIENNTIVGFLEGIKQTSATSFLIQNNIITNNVTDLTNFVDATGIWYNLLGGGQFQTQGNFMDDPLFVNATNHDYHLQDWISPAIDKGHPDSRFEGEPASFTHVESVNGGRVNLGAYGNTPEAAASRDLDLDGISDAEELDRGLTSTGLPPATDADGDGIPDDWEVVRNTNPSMADGNDDLDGDGFSNVLEFILGTLPDNEFSYPTVNTIHVNPLNQTGFENGSATDPYEKLSTALLNANDGDTLILSAGPHDETSVVKVEKSVRIMGAPNRGSHLTVPNISYGASGGQFPLWGELLGLRISGRLSMLTNATKNVTVVGNDISTTANGIALSGSYNTVIKNNVLRGPGTTHFGIRLAGSTGATIENNTIVGFLEGIKQTSATSFLIQNNIITNNVTDLTNFVDATGIWYNLLGGGQFQTQGNIMGDPLFLDVINHDYHLEPVISPAIDAGNPSSDVSDELPDNGGLINLGAYGNTAEAALSQ